jgi:hypothetical protein
MSSGAMGDPPYANSSKLVRSYCLSSENCVSKLIIVGTSTVRVTRSRATISQKLCGLNFGIVIWQVPKAGEPNIYGKS